MKQTEKMKILQEKNKIKLLQSNIDYQSKQSEESLI